MLSQEIRRGFLNYFEKKGHVIVPSSSVIPHDDPTLLFTNAGMNQFKDAFLGKSQRDYTRASTTQKCIRCGGKHNDLENVGHTSRHHTFFEMLGNFSFGDYFKKEAIQYAWEVSTEIFGFDPERIYASVFKEDDEAFALWEKYLPANRIVRFGEEENFWAMGDTGPCGPCSELLYDRGKAYGDAVSPVFDPSGERYLEFWNLVFMQFERDAQGNMTPLPKQSIDTGAGLERVVSLKMDVHDNFQIDLFQEIIHGIERISGIKYDSSNKKLAPAFHVIADHIRCLAFAIADGGQPSNVDRGYVLRKVLRRAVRYGKILGLNKPFLGNLLPSLTQVMGDDFPELKASQNRTEEILYTEEETFHKTLVRGGNLLADIIKESDGTISGDNAFKLKDTYGFPLEEILLIAKDEHLNVDTERFYDLENEAKEKSKRAHKDVSQVFDQSIFKEIAEKLSKTTYLDQQKVDEATILSIVHNDEEQKSLKENAKGAIILNKTPFYAEMGGQVGDTGWIQTETGKFKVEKTVSPYPGLIVHYGLLEKGSLEIHQKSQAVIDIKRRKDIERNHTATHLLHYSLQQVVGPHIRQSGSYVDPNYLRFDFNHHKGLTKEELRRTEIFINEKIQENLSLCIYEESFSKVQKDPSIKQFFGEKYGTKVRVVDIDFSKELCGGSHVKATGEIGLFKIIKESSIAAGIRRIEAVTGMKALESVYQEEDLIDSLASEMKTLPHKTESTLKNILLENKDLKKENKCFKQQLIEAELATICKELKEHKGIPYLCKEVSFSGKELTSLAESIAEKLPSHILILGSKSEGKCQVLIKISDDLVQKGLFASNFIKMIAPTIEGGGGGKKDAAQAGGKNPQKLKEALNQITTFIDKTC
ncbi:MAG TPA: alanine--tRNA ligase [Chlamydiales bacterium]|nr:alanine--tRNA ligase [Chlamydiales bacterium]